MTDLSFLALSEGDVLDTWRKAIRAKISKKSDLPSLSEIEREQLNIVLDFLITQPTEQFASILEEIKCPQPKAAAEEVIRYLPLLKKAEPEHNLIDFDWSVSLILGNKLISNLKEPIASFRFDYLSNEKGTQTEKSQIVEMTLDDAQSLLAKLEAARGSQKSLIQK